MAGMDEHLSAAPAGAALIPPLLEATRHKHAELIFLPRDSPQQEGEAWSFARFHDEVRFLAAALLSLGFERGQRIGLFADNRRAWILVDQALAATGLVSVPRGRDTAPAELQMIAEHSGCSAVFFEDEEHAAPMRTRLPQLRCWTLDGDGADSLQQLLQLGRELFARGEAESLLLQAREAIEPEDILTIVYTSGTTDSPKGVVLTHRNVRSNVDAACAVLDIEPGGRMLSILPAWHMYERIKEYVALARGCPIIYTDTRRLKNDLRELSPQLVAFVPRIWEQLAAGLKARLEEAPRYKRALLAPVFALGARVAAGKAGPLTRALHQRLSRTLLAPLWKALGGQLRIGVSGGSALPVEVDRFLVSLGLPIVQGYGLTETSPVVSVRDPQHNRAETVGAPLPETEIQIRSPEGAVLAPGENGEIWIRGPQVMRGYYRDEAKTRAVLDDNGWLHSGDLGHIDQGGELSILGRCKDTIVLKSGENVEPEPIECQLRTSPWIHQVMLVGQDKKQVGALVVPDYERVAKEASHGEEPKIRLHQTLRQEFDRLLGEGSAFRPVDRVGPFHVMDKPFSYEDGTETETLKLRRKVIHQSFAREIEAMFETGEAKMRGRL
ncbi:MAG: hypothetical protein CSA62_14120 [Planctomycetota bacterium]|nr:MAG: hypothetical protein CSA62_14120 [Planctomycetota bacterium]